MTNTNDLSIIQLSAQEVPQLVEVIMRGKDWVNYGESNTYPEFLWGLYKDSADHQSIIDGIVSYVVGGGMKTTNQSLFSFFNKVNKDEETIDDILVKTVLDYLIFGGFTSHVIPTNKGELSQLFWLDFMRSRTNEDEDTIFYSTEWGKWGTKPEPYAAFDKKNSKREQIFYFKGHKTRGIYPLPLYNAAIKAILTDIEIGNFHLNNISNGFQVSTMLNFNNGEPSPELKREIEKKITDKFNGTSGSKIMTTFNESKEKAVTVEKLNADNFDEQFNTLKKNVQGTIFTAHKVTSPALFGIKMEGTGFSKTEYKEAWEIFNQTVIESLQKTIEDEFYKLFKPYFNTLQRSEISIEPYTLKNLEDESSIN